jgi:hypothetical protein
MTGIEIVEKLAESNSNTPTRTGRCAPSKPTASAT